MANLDAGGGGGERELVLSLGIDAPRERVFDAWLDPAHIGQWWGPNGFTTDVDEMDVREGGTWRFTLHGPDGSDYRNRIVYTELKRPERLGYQHGDDAAPWFDAEVTFAPEGDATLLALRMTCPSAQQLEQLKQSGAQDGAEQTLERLARYLAGYGSEI